MERGILTQEYRHEPVMLGEVLESLRLKSGSVVCDCTLGGAGHSVKMAAQVGETGLLLGVDQDDMALEAAGARLDREVPGVPHQLLKGNFGDLDELLCSAEVPGVDGFLFDLGVSSPQLDIPGRGFSYNEDAPLDMRMDPGTNTLNAAEVINTYNEHDRPICRDHQGGYPGCRSSAWRTPGQEKFPGHSHRGQSRARCARTRA